MTMGYDRFPELLIDEKAALFPAWLERRTRLLFTHDPSCAACRLSREEGTRYSAVEVEPRLEGVEL